MTVIDAEIAAADKRPKDALLAVGGVILPPRAKSPPAGFPVARAPTRGRRGRPSRGQPPARSQARRDMTPAPAACACVTSAQVEAFTRPPPSPHTPHTKPLREPAGATAGHVLPTPPRRRSALLSAVFKALAAFLTRSLGPSSIPSLGDGVMLGTAWIDRPVDTRGCTPASTSLPCSMEVQPCPCHLRPVIRLRH